MKRFLGFNKNLLFNWRQTWDNYQNNTSILTKVLPFFSYEMPYTCGPDYQDCCLVDFRNLYEPHCPFSGISTQPITEKNVAKVAKILLHQFRKSAQIVRENVVLYPMGGDFCWSSEQEINSQFRNTGMLMDYMNSAADMHVDIQYGTLKEYFVAVQDDSKHIENAPPIYQGDFFPYADLLNEYWSVLLVI